MPSDYPLPANVKEVLSRLPVKDQGEFLERFFLWWRFIFIGAENEHKICSFFLSP